MLNYTYIEQLISKYFECETTLEEEKILRTFFCQSNVPEHLLRYKDLFVYEQFENNIDSLGNDFDARLMEKIGITPEKETMPKKQPTLRVSIVNALQPFFRAAAIVAVVITIGNASQVLFENNVDETTSVANVESNSGKNFADVQKTDSIQLDSLKLLNN